MREKFSPDRYAVAPIEYGLIAGIVASLIFASAAALDSSFGHVFLFFANWLANQVAG